MKIIGKRKIEDIDVLLINSINNLFKEMNKSLNKISINILPIDLHIIDRIHDRNFYPDDVITGLSIFNISKLCEFVYYLTLSKKQHNYFCLIFKNKFVIHGIILKKDFNTLVKFKTIVKYYHGYIQDNRDDIQIIID